MSAFTNARDNVVIGLQAAARGTWAFVTSTWAGMSEKARSLVIGLAIGFALGAFAAGMIL